jgi:PPE-repeat protein
MMNFATLPPEITSGRIYDGLGWVTMVEASRAWERLAIRLCTAAADYRAVTSQLARGGDPAAAAMTEAAVPYIDWLNDAAAHAGHAAAQAQAAATAYEAALAAMAPPTLIADNRAQRIALAKTNCLGQNSMAIADVETRYERMWAQDADAMYTYARACARASDITPFTSPPGDHQASGDRVMGTAAELMSAGHQVMSAISHTLQGLSSSPTDSFDSYLLPVTAPLSKLSSLTAPWGSAIGYLNSLNKAAALRWLLPNQGGARGEPITARLSRATSIGRLSAPRAWSTGVAAGPAGAAVRAG